MFDIIGTRDADMEIIVGGLTEHNVLVVYGLLCDGPTFETFDEVVFRDSQGNLWAPQWNDHTYSMQKIRI